MTDEQPIEAENGRGEAPAGAAEDNHEAEALEGRAEEVPREGEDAPSEEARDEEPESELDAARRERDEFLDLAQRARAELENYRRRTAAEAQTAEQRGRAAVARSLIGGLDNLERALLAAGVDPHGQRDGPEPRSEEVSSQTALAEGVALVYRDLRDGLARHGVESFDPRDERFDPNLHEAVATGSSEGAEKGLVIETLEKGYRIGETVLRPARVVVNG